MLVSLVLALLPLVIAIRVVRGFAVAPLIAALTCGVAGVIASVELARAAYPTGPLAVAAALGALGAVAAILAWFEQRRANRGAVIELERTESLELSPIRHRRS